MGSPLSPVIANFFIEDFEEQAMKLATHDTFVIWPHEQDKLTEIWTT
jgi:hypothetical protein